MPLSPALPAALVAALVAEKARSVEALLRDLGPGLRRGGPPGEPPRRFATGILAVDRLLGGGFAAGRIGEIAGPTSSGRTSLALALLARTTGAGEFAAVVDADDSFDPTSADTAGAELDRLLWVRAPELRAALRSTEHLLEARGFGLVLLNLAAAPRRIAPATWPRLARTAAASGTGLVVLSAQRMAGTSAEAALELKTLGAHFTGTPPLLEELEIEAALVRHRTAPGRRASVRLRSAA